MAKGRGVGKGVERNAGEGKEREAMRRGETVGERSGEEGEEEGGARAEAGMQARSVQRGMEGTGDWRGRREGGCRCGERLFDERWRREMATWNGARRGCGETKRQYEDATEDGRSWGKQSIMLRLACSLPSLLLVRSGFRHDDPRVRLRSCCASHVALACLRFQFFLYDFERGLRF